jgi:eukaryotic-like serine/threonine-protein kinase
MALTPGARLGPYEISAQIGAGGMGEVYRARDTNLDRHVAIKILPEDVAQDPERLARFEREAKTLASLNHPHIAHVYGLEKSQGTYALVMELVEGEDLSQRIARGPIPVDEALLIAKQIAEALEAAHEQGIIHRDLKPANIKVRADGTVKVLDFGLAKALELAGAKGADATASPTITSLPLMTGVGAILGTAAYMAPEQARGKRVDKRTDIWAFGAVLYEILTGAKPFPGDDVQQILAHVIDRDPDWNALPTAAPPTLGVFLRRCLQKDPRQRIHDIADVRLALEGAFDTAPPVTSTAPPRTLRLWQRPVPAAILALSLAAVTSLATSAVWWRIVRPAQRALTRFVITPPAAAPFTPEVVSVGVALSPDGRAIVYVGGTGPQRRLYIRRLDQVDVLPIAGTEGAESPFFSPDSQWIGFAAAEELKKVRVTGGPPVTLFKLSSGDFLGFSGASWGANDVIIFAARSGLWRVAAAGGEATSVTTLEAGEAGHSTPHILPGGKAAIFTILSASLDAAQIGVVAFNERGQRRAVLGGRFPHYTASGHLVFWQTGALWAVPFDVGRLTPMGEPVRVVEGVGGGIASRFSISADGTLVYLPIAASDTERTLVLVDRKGQATPVMEAKAPYMYPRFSPDGQRVAVNIGGGSGGGGEIRICDIDRHTCSRLTSGNYPVWTPDGSRVTFNAPSQLGDVDLYWTRSDGSGKAEPLLMRSGIQWPFSWSPDSRLLTFNEVQPAGPGLDLWLLDRGGPVTPLVVTQFDQRMATFSPDGRWLAYQSNESGRFEIYVRPYPGPGGRELVSTNGGREAVWSRDGRELFYREANRLMVVSLDTSAGFKAGLPRLLFEGYINLVSGTNYDVSPNGQRFVMVQGNLIAQSSELRVVRGWFEELKQKVPTN